ncbi:MAG: M24 family metallopeptidase [Haloplanus sp.]
MTDAVGAVEPALTAASAGLVAVAARLADATAASNRLVAEGNPLTVDRLERTANAAVADAGGDPAGRTRVETRDGVRPGDPLVVALSPRIDGVGGPLARTFVVDGTGGWERRAAVAVEMAHDAVRRIAEPGRPARRVVDEAVAELGAFGLAAAESPVAEPVGASTPDFSTDTPLDPGTVFALRPVAVAPGDDRGRIRIGRCYAVTESGCRSLDDIPTSLSPSAYTERE